MLECPICNRLFDERFRVFAPPYPEPYDKIECARRASAAWGADEHVASILLPTVEAPRPHSEPRPALVSRRLSVAALALSALVPAQAALAGGAALFTGGTAASLYLAANQAPGAPASKPTVRVQSPTRSSGPSPQVPARSLVTGPPAPLAWEGLASPERAPAPRHANRDKLARQLQIAVARDVAVAQSRSRPVPGELAAPQRPTQSSTEPHAAAPMAKPSPEPTSAPKPKPIDTQKPIDTPNQTETTKPKHTKKPTNTQNPKDTKKPTDTPKPKNKPTDTSKPEPPATKPPTAGTPAPPNRQPTPASAPEPQPTTTTPPTTSEPTHAPPNDQSGPPNQNGSHGEGNGNGNNGKGHGH
jgi:hypothetical protein